MPMMNFSKLQAMSDLATGALECGGGGRERWHPSTEEREGGEGEPTHRDTRTHTHNTQERNGKRCRGARPSAECEIGWWVSGAGEQTSTIQQRGSEAVSEAVALYQ